MPWRRCALGGSGRRLMDLKTLYTIKNNMAIYRNAVAARLPGSNSQKIARTARRCAGHHSAHGLVERGGAGAQPRCGQRLPGRRNRSAAPVDRNGAKAGKASHSRLSVVYFCRDLRAESAAGRVPDVRDSMAGLLAAEPRKTEAQRGCGRRAKPGNAIEDGGGLSFFPPVGGG